MVIAGGTDVRTVASCLGHSNVAMTLNTYAEVDPDAKKAALGKVDEAFDIDLDGVFKEPEPPAFTLEFTVMQNMFGGCSGLTDLDVSGFDTSKVTNMRHMFYGCTGLTSLDLSSFDTSAVQDMFEMFWGCSNLERLDISGFDTSRAVERGENALYRTFYGCSALKEVKLGEKTLFTENATLPVIEWQLADLGDTSVRYEKLTAGDDALVSYDGSRPGWYVQGYGDVAVGGVVDAVYAGAPVKPTPTVRVGGRALVAGEDYEVSYANNVNAGTATVKVAGKGVWAGSANATFAIAPKAVTPTVSLSQASYTYDGRAKTPAVTVKDGQATLPAGGYEVAYGANTNAGTATVKVTLKGNYSGTASASFTIGKAANAMTAKGKTVTVKYSKARKKAQTVKAAKAFAVKGAKGKVTYKVTKWGKNAKKYVKVASNGKVTVKKGARNGTYAVKVKVTAAGNANYKAKSKTVTLKVKVK